MLSFHSQLKVFIATAPCDLRKSFHGLWAAAQETLGEDPKGGALFVFGIPDRCYRLAVDSDRQAYQA